MAKDALNWLKIW